MWEQDTAGGLGQNSDGAGRDKRGLVPAAAAVVALVGDAFVAEERALLGRLKSWLFERGIQISKMRASPYRGLPCGSVDRELLEVL